jgi:hypothetical protein
VLILRAGRRFDEGGAWMLLRWWRALRLCAVLLVEWRFPFRIDDVLVVGEGTRWLDREGKARRDNGRRVVRP